MRRDAIREADKELVRPDEGDLIDDPIVGSKLVELQVDGGGSHRRRLSQLIARPRRRVDVTGQIEDVQRDRRVGEARLWVAHVDLLGIRRSAGPELVRSVDWQVEDGHLPLVRRHVGELAAVRRPPDGAIAAEDLLRQLWAR